VPKEIVAGLDYHPSFRQGAFLIEETGEYDEQRLTMADSRATLSRPAQREIRVRVGMEAAG